MMQPFILMEQYRSSLTPRTQRRSQNICSDTAKIQTLFETTKFWSSKCREKLVFPLCRFIGVPSITCSKAFYRCN